MARPRQSAPAAPDRQTARSTRRTSDPPPSTRPPPPPTLTGCPGRTERQRSRTVDPNQSTTGHAARRERPARTRAPPEPQARLGEQSTSSVGWALGACLQRSPVAIARRQGHRIEEHRKLLRQGSLSRGARQLGRQGHRSSAARDRRRAGDRHSRLDCITGWGPRVPAAGTPWRHGERGPRERYSKHHRALTLRQGEHRRTQVALRKQPTVTIRSKPCRRCTATASAGVDSRPSIG